MKCDYQRRFIHPDYTPAPESLAREMAEFIVGEADQLTFGHGLKREYVNKVESLIVRAEQLLKELKP